jgi:3-vinyl bacteriochlorophyllide hydratase
MFTTSVFGRIIDSLDFCPWGAAAGRHVLHADEPPARRRPLYTPEERVRRDASPWTIVQGVLAPVQFAVFLVSLCLVLRYLATGDGQTAATASIVVKTLVLYTIMITGSIWEKVVFDRYLFAPSFFWEDVFSMLVLALHTAYLVALLTDFIGVREQMFLALAAYATYVINATQFILKLRAARLDQKRWPEEAPAMELAQ